MVTKPSESDVLVGFQGDPVAAGDITSSDLDSLIDEAVAMFDELYGDQVLFTGETEDESNAVKSLARHKLAIAVGQTVESEGQAGANVTYTGHPMERSLSRTTYGLEFLEYVRDTPNIGVFRTR